MTRNFEYPLSMSKQETEYECQFWRFCAKEIASGLRGVILDSLETCVTKMFDAVRQRKQDSALSGLANNCHILLNEYAINAKDRIANFENFILKTFSIPRHILLKEDNLQRQQYTEEEKENLEKEIQQLWKEINRVHFLETYLSKELEKHKQTEAILQRLEILDLPSIDAVPSPKSVHHPILDTLGLEVEEAGCHLKGEKDTEDSNNLDLRDNVFTLCNTRGLM